ncbi:MAG TPA: Bax inhibitor-1/YccA family protein, partial [Phototrophicaceae bacterium]|nr:Bax inhibitor-1/YccA family protein [Phototrophicaceae bacterium]
DLRGSTGAVLGAIVVEFGLVIALSMGITRKWLNPTMAALLFFLYAAVNGFVLSIIALVFDAGAITNALATTVLLFGVMSVFGYTTQMDLTRMGSYLIMGLIGLVVAMFVNVFLNSGPLEYIISIFGVIIFTGLTAYDTQKIRNFTQTYQLQADGNLALKFSIYGALVLYLDFVNLFLFLVQLFGGGRRR